MRTLPAVLTLAVLGLTACGPEVPVFKLQDFSTDPARPVPLNGRMLTTNNGDDTLSVVDVANRTVVGRLPVGFIPVELEGPHHLSADPAGQYVYVNLSEAVAGSGTGPHGAHGTGTVPGYTLKIRAEDGILEDFARVDPNPGDNTLTADGKTLFVTHYDLLKLAQAQSLGDIRKADTNLAIIDTETMNVSKRVALCPLAHGARLSHDGKTLYASCATDEIAVVRLDDPTFPVRRVALHGLAEAFQCTRCPYALSVAPDDTVWVSGLGAGNGTSGGGGVDVYDPALGDFDAARRADVCGRALFAAFGPGPGGAGDYRVYVPEQGCNDAIRIYRPGGPGVAPVLEGTIPLPADACLNAHMLTVSDDGASAELVCEGDHARPGSMVFLDLQNRVVTGTLPLGVFPDGMAFVPARAP